MPKSLLIDPIARTVTPIDCQGYVDLVKYMPGGITIGWRYDNDDVMYVDDEGLLRPVVCAFRVKGREDGQPYVSAGIVQGPDRAEIREGALHEVTIDVQSSVDEVTASIEWLTVEQALAWFRSRRDFAAVTVTSHHTGTVILSTWQDFLTHLEGDK